jgi:hypothetical protein
MLIPFLASALLVAPVTADTTITFGIVTRDLTGDTTPEVMTVNGNWFFGDSKFMSPERFVSELRASARLHIPLIPEVISHQMTPRDSSRARMIWDQMQTGG